MKTEVIKLQTDHPEQIRNAALKAGEVLKNGGIAAFPTDTVYGLGAVYSDAEAVRSIFTAKGRPESKPLSILVSDSSQVELLAEDVSAEARILMDRFWPGALTLIFRKRKAASIPPEVTAGGDTIGIRMPDCSITLRIIEAAGSPLAAPSANQSGKRSSVDAQQVREDLEGRIPLIIDGGTCPVGISSTVADVSGEQIRILREGTVTAAMIEDAVQKK